MRIIVVDDEADFAETIAAQLRLAGHDAVTATDGRSGIELAKASGAEAVITDMLMPAMDGIEVIRALRQELAELWIVAVSGGSGAVPSSMALNFSQILGADRVLFKPFSATELLAALEATPERPEPGVSKGRG